VACCVLCEGLAYRFSNIYLYSSCGCIVGIVRGEFNSRPSSLTRIAGVWNCGRGIGVRPTDRSRVGIVDD
jgi:hypothetical protein